MDLDKSSQQRGYNIVTLLPAYGHHNVVIKVLGTKNTHSIGTGIVCDGFTINENRLETVDKSQT